MIRGMGARNARNRKGMLIGKGGGGIGSDIGEGE